MNLKSLFRVFVLCSLFVISSCSNDDDETPIITGNFTVTIENVFQGKEYFTNGTTGLIEPGMSESFSFNAGKGSYLSFATMFVQSNDLFYAPNDIGLALYDSNGDAVTGDITSMIDLWDAGTEVNEEPGVGNNQPPRQSGPNTGADENGTVELITNIMDGFTYPADEDVIKVTMTHDGETMFTVTIENVSNGSSLPTPFAPGVWVINNDAQMPLFTEGSASTEGLERMAEDGNNSILDASLTASSGYVSPFAPGAYRINDAIFTIGNVSSSALESLAEDGDPSGFTNVFNTPVGGSSPAPIFPGDSYSFEFSAEEGDVLSFATMLVQSNDWFIGANDIDLFENGTAISGEITSMISLYDSGTEVDEYAGAGNNQPVRQSGANIGVDENGVVEEETSTGDHVPSVSAMVKVTITSN